MYIIYTNTNQPVTKYLDDVLKSQSEYDSINEIVNFCTCSSLCPVF